MPTRIPVLIDTDVDFDDYMAMLYLLMHPGVNVQGITVTGSGDVHLSHGVRNVNDMLLLLDDPAIHAIPVAAGARAPMIYSNTFPYDARKAADEHYEAEFPGSNPKPVIRDAVSFLKDYLRSCRQPVTVLCIGGGSNWGRLFQQAGTDPELRRCCQQKISRIVMMGGNLLPRYVGEERGAEGNIQPTLGDQPYYTNRVAEWNIFIDPLGAQYIFDSGIPITLVALNATQQVPITQALTEQLAAIDNAPARFLTQVLNSSTIAPGIGKYLDFWDPLAAEVLVDASLVQTERFTLRVEQQLDEEDDHSGELIPDTDGAVIEVAMSADREQVYAEFLKVISQYTA
ncbi:nucleoside hydrolase [Pokkaliibacter plantistimulans]|uniref:Nucleoside hydrolase n=1 Tax=Proteobacteria bacterium 228 TaxID=2083153 RepID=A0A2S5KLI9_9PROT|nr:nucleoside hydrolase [Pokkaliibacter plantistimulans]PPC75582.1 nucleoside hydrolase [Pokkaliibacter plantistimulans]